MYKTQKELELMTKSGQIAAYAKKKVMEAIVPGVTTKDLDNVAEKAIREKGAKPAFLGYQGFTGTICASINNEMIHGIPSSEVVIKEGDLVKIDLGANYNGFYSDTAFTIGVGNISKIDQKLIDVAREAFYSGLNEFKVGNRIGDVSAAIGNYIRKSGFYTPTSFSGHGIGKKLHEDPYVQNYGKKNTGTKIKEGMVVAIEPMILQNSSDVLILNDGWTVVSIDGSNTSHYEQTVAIINGEARILTEEN